METQVNNPLVIQCMFCGGRQSFDIVKQKYVCPYCCSESDITEKKTEYRNWKSIHHKTAMRDSSNAKAFLCPSCGAQTIAANDDASAQCPFCQSTMIDARFSGNDIPEVIIPFKLTKEEAEAKLNEWLNRNKGNKAAKALKANIQNLSGCYLPYHIVRGALNSSLDIRLQDGSSTAYPFRAYLSHTAVNASKDFDNLFLDGIEPFDFEEAREFEFGYLNRQNAKVQNITNQALEYRIKEETEAELYETLTKKIRTKEMSISVHDDQTESIPALLPVYMLKCKNGVTAAVNGQTGKVSIGTGRVINKTKSWWIVPTLATLVVGAAGAYFGDGELGFIGALVFGIVFFAIAHNRHEKVTVNEVLSYPETKASHNDTQAEFFANFGQGPVPAKIKFFSPWRTIKTILIVLAVIFLPVLIAIPIQLLRGMSVFDIKIAYGAAWYIIPGFFAILAAGGLAKTMMYGSPMYYEILPNGTTRRRKLPQKSPSLKELLSHTKLALSDKVGCFLIGFTVFLLLGSVFAMLPGIVD